MSPESKPDPLPMCDVGRFLHEALWQFQQSGQFTDLTLACSDGTVPAHRAMLAGVFKLLGVNIDCQEEVEFLVIPGVAVTQVETAMKDLYLENKSEKLLNLFCCRNVKSELINALNVVEIKPELYSDDEDYSASEPVAMKEYLDEFGIKQDLSEYKMQNIKKQDINKIALDPTNPLNAKFPDRPKHIERLKICTCEDCGYVARTAERLQKHKSCYHDNKHDCVYCDFSTTLRKELKSHRREEHNDLILQERLQKQQLSKLENKKEKPIFQCDDCGKHCTTKAGLQDHMLTHSEEKKFVCPECGKKLKRRYCLTLHMKIHSGDKNYQCDQCEAKYISSAALRNHTLSKHTDRSNAEHFICNYCGQDFLKKAYLDRHIMLHTGEKKYKCEVCPKSFRLETSFKDHMNMHNGIKNHQCPLCEKRFTQRQQMTMHLRRHTGDKRHKCEICEQAFIEPSSLRKHIQTHHN